MIVRDRRSYQRWYRGEKKRCAALGIPMPVRHVLPKTTDKDEQRKRARARNRKYKLAHPEKIKDSNTTGASVRNKRWYDKHRTEILIKEKIKRDSGKRKHIIQKYLDKKKAKRIALKIVLTEEDILRKKEEKRKRIVTYRVNYVKRRLKRDPYFKFELYVRQSVRRIIKNARGDHRRQRTFELIGTDRDGLILHMESLFTVGMTWDNYGKWHIDHVRPIKSFDFSKESDVLAACHYTNLQPLWASDNKHKAAKWIPDMGSSLSSGVSSSNGFGHRAGSSSTDTIHHQGEAA